MQVVALLAYHEKFLADELLPDDEARKVSGALIAISAGGAAAWALDVPKRLSREWWQC